MTADAIFDMADKDIWIQLRERPGFVKFLMNLTQDQRVAFASLLSFDRDLFGKINKHPDVLSLLSNLTDGQFSEIGSLLELRGSTLQIFDSDVSHLTNLYHAWDHIADKARFVDAYTNAVMSDAWRSEVMTDAFSLGQIKSKSWLIQVCRNLGLKFGSTWVLCGWIGVLSYLLIENRSQLGIERIRSFDIDPQCGLVADILNGEALTDDWYYKSGTVDVNQMMYENWQYQVSTNDGSAVALLESADTVINTSTDHLTDDDWFERIPSGKLVIIQNNDYKSLDVHANTVENEFELMDRYPLSTVVHFGKLKCTGYNRYMTIGYK